MTNSKPKIYYCDVLTEDKKLHKNIVYKEGNTIHSLVKGKPVFLKVSRIITIHHELNKGETFFKAYDEKIDNKRGFCVWIKKSSYLLAAFLMTLILLLTILFVNLSVINFKYKKKKKWKVAK